MSHNTRLEIGQRLAEIRKAKGLTQTQIAEAAGIRQQHVARVEAGLYSVGIDLLAKIVTALDYQIELMPK